MEIPLRGFEQRVKLNTFRFLVINWKNIFPAWEKLALVLIATLTVLTTATWAWAASRAKTTAPRNGGVFVEGVVTDNMDSLDLGRLTKSGLTRINEKGDISEDLAKKWEISDDKLDYKFTLVDGVSSYEIADTVKSSPTYLPDAALSPENPQILKISLKEPDSNLLSQVSQPIFPHGPYVVDKKTKNEIRLKRNTSYHLDAAFIDRFIIRSYPDQNALQKAANRNKINGALGLDDIPKNWQSKEVTLGKKHFLFINSSKTYLKATSTRETILNGEKPDSLSSLDVLEVNGVKEDAEYFSWKKKIKASGVELKIRKVALKDALKEDLPKRNYDILYILIAEGQTQDPYLFWNSTERSSIGQNFSELANADIDELTEQFRSESDLGKKDGLAKQIRELVDEEKIAIEYKSITAKYAVSAKIKGFAVSPTFSCEADRFAQAAKWYIYEKKVW